MAQSERRESVIAEIVSAATENDRVRLIRQIPDKFGKAEHQEIYSEIARSIYVTSLAPDFAFVHWRDDYELEDIERTYRSARDKTIAFTETSPQAIAAVIAEAPATLRIFRLLLGLTTQEFSSAALIVAAQTSVNSISNAKVKSIESGKLVTPEIASLAAEVIDQVMHGILFGKAPKGLRSKIFKPDTRDGWETVRLYASERVPLEVFLHQRHYGGSFRQLLDATSSLRGNAIEQTVDELLLARGIPFFRTGSGNQAEIARKFGLTLKPAPDFVIYDLDGNLLAILECKQVNDGGTARDKAARFAALRSEAMRLGGVPVFAVLSGLGWTRTMDALGPVIRDTDGRVFTPINLESMMRTDPFPRLVTK